MIPKKYILIFFLIIIQLNMKKYKSYLPTIPIYPDNEKEILIVQNYVKNRSMNDISLFQKTDESITYAFVDEVNESLQELNSIITSTHILIIIYLFKYSINRARPKQINPTLNVLKSNTADTPAYPSGHAFQAYYLSKYLSDKYPHKKELFDTIAEECAMARVYAGLHFPSDNQFSRQMTDLLFYSL